MKAASSIVMGVHDVHHRHDVGHLTVNAANQHEINMSFA